MSNIASALRGVLACTLLGTLCGAVATAALGAVAMLIAVLQVGAPWDYYGMAVGMWFAVVYSLFAGSIGGCLGGAVGGSIGKGWSWGLGGVIGGASLGLVAASWFPQPFTVWVAVLGGGVGIEVGSLCCGRETHLPLLARLIATRRASALEVLPLWERTVVGLAVAIPAGTAFYAIQGIIVR